MRRVLIVLLVLMLVPLTLPGMSRADDTEIYGTSDVSIPPNVLIIFDNSGSMGTDDVPGDPYDPTVTYTGNYTSNAVYYKYTSRWWWGGWGTTSWQLFASDVGSLSCSSISTTLQSTGYAQGQIYNYAPYACSGNASDNYTLRTGNYMNYVVSGGGANQTRIAVAKQVITNLINKTNNVRFGLMVFNDSQGGHLVAPCGTDKTTLINDVNALTASTWTPLAETLAEAGLYFAGMPSWFNSGVTYTSPIQYPCQKNYIVIMTDGEPTQDNDSKLYSAPYINGDIIGDFNKDGLDSGPNANSYPDNGSDYLDDVADYLYTQDVDPSMGSTNASFERQNIVTYTIGYTTDNDLLQRTAENGGGQYYVASNYSSLAESFDYIMSNIQQANGVFVAPVVPVNQLDRSYSGDRVYLGFFEPASGGNWYGNIKSYYMVDSGTNTGEILNQDDSTAATDSNGQILPGAQSIWSSTPDGPSVTKGGVGEVLQNRTTTRNIYTYLGTNAALTDSSNAFSLTNSALTNTLLNVPDDTTRQNVVNHIYSPMANWKLGDFIHSEPAVINYSNLNKTYIFAGSNDGMLHVFDDSNGSEAWAFVPPDQLGNLYALLGNTHNYFVDGSPTAYGWTDTSTVDHKILLTGERRGGNHYFALDISNPTSPTWGYQLGPQLLVNIDGDGNGTVDGTAATLGQSWCTPTVHTIKTGDSTTPSRDVFLLAGGYDTNQDLTTPAATDSVGRAIYTIDAKTGQVSGIDVNAGNYSLMTNCITDVAGFDTNGDGYMNRVYAGDLGGHIFALRDDAGSGTWEKRLFFQLPTSYTPTGSTTAVNLGQKFMYAPDITEETYGDFVFIGTGDRAHPTDTTHTDCLYAIQNDWAYDNNGVNGNYDTLTINDLTDVTDNLIQVGTSAQKTDEQTKLANSKGWFIRLTNPGEKIVASPVVFGGSVYFTTYTPGTGTVSSTDPCDVASDRGVARLYVVSYKDGSATNDLNGDGTKTTADRSMVIGTSIPSSPVVAVFQGGPRVLVGVEGGLQSKNSGVLQPIVQYFWRQLN